TRRARAQEERIGDLARRDLEPCDTKGTEKVDARDVERRRHHLDPSLSTANGDGFVRVLVELQRADHLELRLALAGGLLLVLGLRGARADDAVRSKSLELHDVRAGACGLVDEQERAIDGSVVI